MARNGWMDVLRFVAVMFLVPYHSPGAPGQIYSFISYWQMPALMMISGIATRKALESKSFEEFWAERKARLINPLLLISFIIGPMISIAWRTIYFIGYGWYLGVLLLFSWIIKSVKKREMPGWFLPLLLSVCLIANNNTVTTYMAFFIGMIRIERKYALLLMALAAVPILETSRIFFSIGLVYLFDGKFTVPKWIGELTMPIYVLHFPMIIVLSITLGFQSFWWLQIAAPLTILVSVILSKDLSCRIILGIKLPLLVIGNGLKIGEINWLK